MKGMMILADHFELCEALITIDLLRRAGIEVDTVSIKNKILNSQSNVNIEADKLIQDINLNDYDFVILPGGKAVFETHSNSDVTKNILLDFHKRGKLIAAICAAPMVLKKLEIIQDEEYTCFPGCEQGGKYTPNKKVVIANNIITSKAMGTTFEFSYEIIKYLKGKEVADKVLASVYYS